MRSCLFLFGVLLAAFASVAQSAEPTVLLWSSGFESDWQKHWHVTKRKWGQANLQVVKEERGQFPVFLRASYPAGSASPTVTKATNAPVGGGQFYADLGIEPRDRMHLRYYVRFAKDFNFVKGGKLPGLFGGTVGTGGQIPDGKNGFTTRLMWRKNGAGEVYAYTPNSVEHGTSLGRGRWRFIPGRWHLIEQKLVLNEPGKSNGSILLWIDEKEVLNQESLTFRTVSTLQIQGILFSTFYGGDDSTWATPNDTYADFAAFAVSEQYIGAVARGK